MEIVDRFRSERLGEGEFEAIAGAPGAMDGSVGAGASGGRQWFAVEFDNGGLREPGGDAEVDAEVDRAGGMQDQGGGVFGRVAGILREFDARACMGEAKARWGVEIHVQAIV